MCPLVTLALAAALFVACDGGNEDRATRSATTTLAATESVTASATAGPVRTPAASATRPPIFRDQQVVIFDVAEQSFTELLSAGRRYFVWTVFPRFTPDGAHVWISEAEALVSHRYHLGGDSVTTVSGIVVGEQDGGGLVYTRIDGTERVVTVRVDGDEYQVPAAAPQGRLALSPGGEHLAYWRREIGETVAYEIADTRTGAVVATASDVGLCQCDGGPAPMWSPSGRYFVFSDFASPPGNPEDPEHGTFALDTATGQQIFLGLNPWTGGNTVLGEDRFLAEREGSIVVLDAKSHDPIRVIAPHEEGTLISNAGGIVATYEVTRDPYEVSTRIYDLESGELLRTEDAQLRPLPIENGVAYERQSAGGQVSLVHPQLPEPHPFAEGFVLAPDGRHVAAAEGSAINIYRIEAGSLERIASYDRPAELLDAMVPILPVEWNPQGTHLLISIGFGL